ncbi:unnamed protein product [Malus baccata var. baccata]
MGDPFFPNEMPDFVAEPPADAGASQRPTDSFMELLHLPYKTLSDTLKSSALDLKETVLTKDDYNLTLLCTAWACRHVSFICWQAGVCTLGAVVAKHTGDAMLLDRYLSKFKELIVSLVSYEQIKLSVVDEIIKAGRQLAKKGRSSLMYEWRGKKYWGAAHGLAGIMHVLMSMQPKPDEVEDVKSMTQYIAFGDEEFLRAAIDAGEVVWNWGLLKRVGICHGNSMMESAGTLMWPKHLLAFYMIEPKDSYQRGTMHGGDRPYSLFEGVGGMALLLLDMTEPSEARFPGYEL